MFVSLIFPLLTIIAFISVESINTTLPIEHLPDIKDGQSCVPGKAYRMDCNTCKCGYDNALICTKKQCLDKETVDLFRAYRKAKEIKPKAKRTNDDSDLPDLPEDGSCEPGQAYKKDCNRCFCHDDKTAMCTVMGCGVKIKQRLKTKGDSDFPDLPEDGSCEPGQGYKKDCNRCFCDDDKTAMCTVMDCGVKIKQRLKTKGDSDFPDLPEDGSCEPGQAYKKDCNRCFCHDDKTAICTVMGCGVKLKQRLKTKARGQLSLTDVRPPFSARESAKLPKLPNMATRCKPGKAYKIDCNDCVCDKDRILICTVMLCISFDDMNRIQAQELTGKQCNGGTYKPAACVTCKCHQKKSKCQPVPKCTPSVITKYLSRRSLHGKVKESNQKELSLNLDGYDGKCIPGAVYREQCNKCYCQKDGSMRCTRKGCLNYVEAQQIKRHQLYLEKHGL